ncbi:hypothetical protein [Planobispora longispora]|uniref:Uncharacterized protein n=1 Tax=Planobispora longispora TaxID=28887 RepID=A0A8J3W9L2_9ACTN|nr:hypothetical protein [Planobispora longispora]BFE88203.1 hypothetical protein GCM10020093_108040 [Planobispora longispora]GIH80912.1 hypothetical protein Plo01_73410 [Planobispora longispora]
MSRTVKLATAGFLATLALGVSTPAAVQAAAPEVVASAASTSVSASVSTSAGSAAALDRAALDRWVTYGHYPTKWQCKAQGKFYTFKKKLAKSYRCVRKVKIGPFKTYRLDLLIPWL